MDGFYGQVNAMNQIDFILAANNTTIMQPFSDTQKPTRTSENEALFFSLGFFAFVSQKQRQNRAWHRQKICTNYLIQGVRTRNFSDFWSKFRFLANKWYRI